MVARVLVFTFFMSSDSIITFLGKTVEGNRDNHTERISDFHGGWPHVRHFFLKTFLNCLVIGEKLQGNLWEPGGQPQTISNNISEQMCWSIREPSGTI